MNGVGWMHRWLHCLGFTLVQQDDGVFRLVAAILQLLEERLDLTLARGIQLSRKVSGIGHAGLPFGQSGLRLSESVGLAMGGFHATKSRNSRANASGNHLWRFWHGGPEIGAWLPAALLQDFRNPRPCRMPRGAPLRVDTAFGWLPCASSCCSLTRACSVSRSAASLSGNLSGESRAGTRARWWSGITDLPTGGCAIARSRT